MAIIRSKGKKEKEEEEVQRRRQRRQQQQKQPISSDYKASSVTWHNKYKTANSRKRMNIRQRKNP